jgi:hypothetical protein
MEMDDEDETDVAMTKEVEQYLEQHHTAQDTVQAPSQFGFCRFLRVLTSKHETQVTCNTLPHSLQRPSHDKS